MKIVTNFNFCKLIKFLKIILCTNIQEQDQILITMLITLDVVLKEDFA
jgi:hypothetical protein